MPRFLFAVLVLCGALHAQPDAAERLDRVVLESGLGQFWGAVVVAKDGKALLAKGYGLADERLIPIARDSLFDIGSVSKCFTAVTILKLQSQGKLSTNDTVSKYFDNLGDAAEKVTLHQLLTHTSGMHDERAIQQLDFDDRDEAVRRAMKSILVAEIGKQFDYCNAGYIVLAAIIEKATGNKYEEVVRSEVLAPAGMTSSGFLDGRGLDAARRTARVVGGDGGPSRRMSLFASKGGEPWAWGLRGAGGIITTLDDLVKWDRALTGDAILTAEDRAQLFKPEKERYACGWIVSTGPDGSMKTEHSGATRGYRAQVARYTGQGVLIAVLTNERWDPIGLEKKLAAALMPELSDSVEATLNLAGLGLNRYKAAEIDKGLAWTVAKDGARLRLLLQRDGTEVARLGIGLPRAASLATSLEAAARASQAGGTSAMIGTMVYEADESNRISLPGGLRVDLLPQYVGVNSDTGERTIDERATLVLVDEDRGFWPLIVKMDSPAARDLAEKIRSALK